MSDFLTHEEVTQLLQGSCPELEAGYQFTKNQIAELEGLRNKVAEQAAVIEKMRSVLRFYIDHGICEPLYYKVKTALWLEIKLGEQATAFKTRIASLEAEVELLKAAVECFNAIEGYGDAHPNTTDLPTE